MKLKVLSEHVKIFLTQSEQQWWHEFSKAIDKALANVGPTFYKKRGMLSWEIYNTPGTKQNPLDDYEDEFKNTPVIDAIYDKFPAEPKFEIEVFNDDGTIRFKKRYPITMKALDDIISMLVYVLRQWPK